MIARWSEATGWRRNLIAVACGVCATLTLAPFFIFPLIIPAYAGLYLLLQAAPSPRRAFLDGWWWGWGFYISGLYWFCIALLTEPEKFAWLIPFALFGLTAVIAIYSGVTAWLFARLIPQGISGIIWFATVWLVVEYARGHLFTGFPWNLAGYAAGLSDGSLQLATVFGAYGLSFIVVLLGALPAALALRYPQAKFVVAVVWFAFAGAWGWGGWRLGGALEGQYVEGVTLRLVQANIAQHHKWDPERQMEGLRAHISLTHEPGLEKITHVIWPETAVPYIIKNDTALTRMLGASIPEGKYLLTGGLHANASPDGGWSIWNSIMMLNHRGTIVGKYDKHKLVPFGEFLPLRELIPDALETPVGMKDFAAGPGPQTLEWPGLPPVSPLICYEVIFPALATADGRAQFLLNLTNDAWFGMSSGPYQHFHMARMRAVEQGIPLVRVANTGISAMVDSHGQILGRLNLGFTGILDVKIPLTMSKPTIYARYGDNSLLGLIFIAFLLIIWQRRRQNN